MRLIDRFSQYIKKWTRILGHAAYSILIPLCPIRTVIYVNHTRMKKDMKEKTTQLSYPYTWYEYYFDLMFDKFYAFFINILFSPSYLL